MTGLRPWVFRFGLPVPQPVSELIMGDASLCYFPGWEYLNDMKPMKLVLGVLLSGATLMAEDQVTVKDVQTTAASLDSLLSQEKQKVAVFAQGAWVRGAKDPINIAAVTPVVGRKLQLEGSEVNAILQKDPTKLSELVMAKLLSDKTGKPWRDLFEGATEQSLIQQLQAEQVPLEKVESTLNHVFADVSFAVMDYESRNEAIGAPAGSEKGKNSSKKKSSK